MSWKDIPGFSSDIEAFYEEQARTLPQGATVIEVGVLFGRSLACLGTLRPDIDLWGVDIWQTGDRGPLEPQVRPLGTDWRAFLTLMIEHAPEVLERVHLVKAWSTSVTLPKADLVFIDADHEEASVRADIAHWQPHVKPGGILSGHDYLAVNFPGVIAAVDELVPGHQKGPGSWTSVWWKRMP